MSDDFRALVEHVRDDLRADAESIARKLLGPPNRGGSRIWKRWRKNSAFALNVRTGGWKDHATGETGDIIALIMRERHCDFGGAIEWACGELGISFRWGYQATPDREIGLFRQASTVHAEVEQTAAREEQNFDPEDEDKKKVSRAQTLWAESVPLVGTDGHRYLTEARGILSHPRAGQRRSDTIQATPH